jgi:hypothetical protein
MLVRLEEASEKETLTAFEVIRQDPNSIIVGDIVVNDSDNMMYVEILVPIGSIK